VHQQISTARWGSALQLPAYLMPQISFGRSTLGSPRPSLLIIGVEERARGRQALPWHTGDM
jgi:hypothetical protein